MFQGNSHLFICDPNLLNLRNAHMCQVSKPLQTYSVLTWWNSEINQDTSEKTHASPKIRSFKRPVWACWSLSQVLTWETQSSHPKSIRLTWHSLGCVGQLIQETRLNFNPQAFWFWMMCAAREPVSSLGKHEVQWNIISLFMLIWCYVSPPPKQRRGQNTQRNS